MSASSEAGTGLARFSRFLQWLPGAAVHVRTIDDSTTSARDVRHATDTQMGWFSAIQTVGLQPDALYF